MRTGADAPAAISASMAALSFVFRLAIAIHPAVAGHHNHDRGTADTSSSSGA
ncbi:hypothetical protein J050_1277 [Klebsiella pneumoniae 361_1301]|nr:hypothetical protein J050_1277 [Klebsiella pneumoniae 361_1301]EPB14520.1 hypothetical protein H210_0872 [Klebsiella pneumoniae UHKPC05]